MEVAEKSRGYVNGGHINGCILMNSDHMFTGVAKNFTTDDLEVHVSTHKRFIRISALLLLLLGHSQSPTAMEYPEFYTCFSEEGHGIVMELRNTEQPVMITGQISFVLKRQRDTVHVLSDSWALKGVGFRISSEIIALTADMGSGFTGDLPIKSELNQNEDGYLGHIVLVGKDLILSLTSVNKSLLIRATCAIQQ